MSQCVWCCSTHWSTHIHDLPTHTVAKSYLNTTLKTQAPPYSCHETWHYLRPRPFFDLNFIMRVYEVWLPLEPRGLKMRCLTLLLMMPRTFLKRNSTKAEPEPVSKPLPVCSQPANPRGCNYYFITFNVLFASKLSWKGFLSFPKQNTEQGRLRSQNHGN